MKRWGVLVSLVSLAFIFSKNSGLAAQADSWKADWEKTVLAAKKEGQLTLYGSPDFEGLFGELHKKYPEIKITGVFNRGADVAKRLMQFFYYSPEIGPEFMKKFFGGMDITYAKNFRQMTDWLAQGKFAICMGCKDSMRAKNQGLPVEDFDTNKWKEGSSFSAGGGSMAYMNQAPHPNAAKVFLNWFLSRKGQIALQKLGDVDDPANSRRIDIPKDDIPPDNRMQPGVKYFDVVKPEYGDMKPIFDLAKEIMAARER